MELGASISATSFIRLSQFSESQVIISWRTVQTLSSQILQRLRLGLVFPDLDLDLVFHDLADLALQTHRIFGLCLNLAFHEHWLFGLNFSGLTHLYAHEGIHTSPSINSSYYFFIVRVLIFFWISACEESSLPMKHAKKWWYHFVWLRRLDSLTHTVSTSLSV